MQRGPFLSLDGTVPAAQRISTATSVPTAARNGLPLPLGGTVPAVHRTSRVAFARIVEKRKRIIDMVAYCRVASS